MHILKDVPFYDTDVETAEAVAEQCEKLVLNDPTNAYKHIKLHISEGDCVFRALVHFVVTHRLSKIADHKVTVLNVCEWELENFGPNVF